MALTSSWFKVQVIWGILQHLLAHGVQHFLDSALTCGWCHHVTRWNPSWTSHYTFPWWQNEVLVGSTIMLWTEGSVKVLQCQHKKSVDAEKTVSSLPHRWLGLQFWSQGGERIVVSCAWFQLFSWGDITHHNVWKHLFLLQSIANGPVVALCAATYDHVWTLGVHFLISSALYDFTHSTLAYIKLCCKCLNTAMPIGMNSFHPFSNVVGFCDNVGLVTNYLLLWMEYLMSLHHHCIWDTHTIHKMHFPKSLPLLLHISRSTAGVSCKRLD